MFNKYLCCCLIIELYFLIIYKLKHSDMIQYSYFSYIIADCHGILVFLKVLNLDSKYIEKNNLVDELTKLDNYSFSNISISDILESLILFDLKLIYKITSNKEDFIYKYLFEIKLYIFLKKMLTIYTNPAIKKYCLKLLKCQLRFFDKNLKVENMFIISSIYTNLTSNSTHDLNYLKYVKRETQTSTLNKMLNKNNPNNSQEENLKKMYVEYNNYHYLKYFNNSNEISNYYLDKKGSYYGRVYKKLQDRMIKEENKKSNESKENYKSK